MNGSPGQAEMIAAEGSRRWQVRRGQAGLPPSGSPVHGVSPPASWRRLRPAWVLWIAVRFLYLALSVFRAMDRMFARLGCASIDGKTEEDSVEEPISEPDASIGPILTTFDAPRLFGLLRRLSGRLGCRLPTEVRLSYIPACGVLEVPVNEVYCRQVLVIGLPCLQIWSRQELRAVLAHELAHLCHQDAAFTRDVLQLIDRLRNRLDAGTETVGRWNPRRIWTRWFVACTGSVAARISRAMEYRADLCSAKTYGSGALSTALEKMAVVQPVFREVLMLADEKNAANVYRVFGRAWTSLSGEKYEHLRDRLIEASRGERSGLHPPVADRLRRLQKLRPGRRREFFPSLHLLDDPNVLERLLHNRLYGLHEGRRSVFRPVNQELADPPAAAHSLQFA